MDREKKANREIVKVIMKVSSKIMLDRDMVFTLGKKVEDLKVIGSITKKMDKVNYTIVSMSL